MTHAANWYHLSLGDAQLADLELARIRQLFLQLYVHANADAQAGIFIRHVTEGHLHCHVHLYFSPACELLARRLNAETCPCPHAPGLDLFAGDENARAVLARNKPLGLRDE